MMQAIKKPETLQKAQDAQKTSERKLAEAYINRIKVEAAANKVEFLPYIEKKLTTWNSEFLVSMQEKINKGHLLTDNMKAALRRMIEKEATYEVDKAKREATKDLPKFKFTVLVKKWWAMQNNLHNFVFTFEVYTETSKAYLVKGNADMVEETFCTFCGRALTEVASQSIGVGPICAAKWGVPYPSNMLTASKKERAALKAQIQKVVRDQKFEGWLPRSQIKEILNREEYKL